MHESFYPRLPEHRLLHVDFVNSVMKSTWDLDFGDKSALSRLCAFLQVWLVAHVQGEDRNFGEFYAAHMKKPH